MISPNWLSENPVSMQIFLPQGLETGGELRLPAMPSWLYPLLFTDQKASYCSASHCGCTGTSWGSGERRQHLFGRAASAVAHQGGADLAMLPGVWFQVRILSLGSLFTSASMKCKLYLMWSPFIGRFSMSGERGVSGLLVGSNPAGQGTQTAAGESAHAD